MDPIKALNPGIIFDAQPEDYRSFLCAASHGDRSLHLITGDNCTGSHRSSSSATALNYPSITIPYLKKSYSVTRTVTNVGNPRSNYHCVVSAPRGINVTVTPEVLNFENYGVKKTFTVLPCGCASSRLCFRLFIMARKWKRCSPGDAVGS